MGKLIEFILNLFCRFTAYGIAVAVASGISSILALVFGFYFAAAINIPITPEIENTLWLTLIATWLMHGAQFGLFAKLGFGGFTRSVRAVNSLIMTTPRFHIRDDLTPFEYKTLLRALIVLPVNNTLTALFYVGVITSVLLVVAVYYAHYDTTAIINGGIMFLIVSLIHSVISFILGELITGKMRAECKRLMTEKGIEFKDRALSTVRLKMFFFLIIFVVALYISNTLTYYNRDNLSSVLGFSIFAIIISMLMAYLVFQIIFNSLKEVEAAVSDLKSGGEGLLFPQSLDSEFVNLATGVVDAARKIKDYQSNLELKVEERTRELKTVNAQLERKDSEMKMELNFAAEIQKGIIPQHSHDWHGLKIASYWKAMETVSGDYFDLFNIRGGKLGVLMADVSGHGVPAALITTMAKVAFGAAGADTDSPAHIFRQVNDQLVNLITTQDYLTAFYITIDESHQFTYANASHQFALIARSEDSTIEALDTEGLFIGALEDASESYSEKKNSLRGGDRLVLYTDGIVERKNQEGEDYGQLRLEKKVKAVAHLSVHEMVEQIIADLEDFAQGTEQTDDVSLLIIGSEPDYAAFLDEVKEAYGLLREGQKQAGAAKLDSAINVYSKNLEVLRTAALVHYELANYTRAAAYFHEYNALSEANAESYFWLSAIEIKANNYDSALLYSKRALELKADYVEALNNMGIALTKLKNYPEAREAFGRAFELDADNSEIKKNLETLEQLS